MCDSNRSTVCLKIVSITPYNWTQYSKFDAVSHRYSASRLFGVVHIFYAHTGQADLARSVSVLGASAPPWRREPSCGMRPEDLVSGECITKGSGRVGNGLKIVG